MTKFASTTRVISLYYASYKLLTDASFIQRIATWTNTRLKSTDGQTSLFALVLILLATTDLIPLLEDNTMYFDTMGRLRAWIFAMLGSVTYFELHPWSSGVLVWYCGAEMALNLAIWSEVMNGAEFGVGSERFKVEEPAFEELNEETAEGWDSEPGSDDDELEMEV